MDAEDARDEFERLLRASGRNLDDLTPAEGVCAMLKFYREVRALDCDLKNDGDMLLFQWGTYDWGNGRRFELNVTRQLIPADTEGQIWQLALTFVFEPEFERLGEGNEWCNKLEAVGNFERFLSNSEALGGVRDLKAGAVELEYENAE